MAQLEESDPIKQRSARRGTGPRPDEPERRLPGLKKGSTTKLGSSNEVVGPGGGGLCGFGGFGGLMGSEAEALPNFGSGGFSRLLKCSDRTEAEALPDFGTGCSRLLKCNDRTEAEALPDFGSGGFSRLLNCHARSEAEALPDFCSSAPTVDSVDPDNHCLSGKSLGPDETVGDVSRHSPNSGISVLPSRSGDHGNHCSGKSPCPEPGCTCSHTVLRLRGGGSDDMETDGFQVVSTKAQRQREKRKTRQATNQPRRVAEFPVVIDGIRGIQGIASLIKEVDRVCHGAKFFGAPRLLERGGIRIHCASEADQKLMMDRSKWPSDAFGGDAWPHLPGQRSARPATNKSAPVFKAVTYSVPGGFSVADLESAFTGAKVQQLPSKKGGFIHLFIFASEELRRHAVDSGLFLYGMKLSFREFRDVRAQQCRYCLQFGHLELCCPQPFPLCPRCGLEAHADRSKCEAAKQPDVETSSAVLYCVNCEAHGHSAYYGGCPKRKSYLAAARGSDVKKCGNGIATAPPSSGAQAAPAAAAVAPTPAVGADQTVLERLVKQVEAFNQKLESAMAAMALGVLTSLDEWSRTGKTSDPMPRVAEVLRHAVAGHGVGNDTFDRWLKKADSSAKPTSSAPSSAPAPAPATASAAATTSTSAKRKQAAVVKTKKPKRTSTVSPSSDLNAKRFLKTVQS